MTKLTIATVVGCTVLMGGFLAPGAKADEWNKKTVVTFSGPVEIPGVHVAGWGVLPAGTYVFKLLDSQSDRHIVQIFNQDETTIYATILAIPNYRLQATDKTVMTFSERPAGQPDALRAWFYPGRNWGDEFVYTKAKAIELAKTTNMPVLFTPEEVPVEVTVPVKSADEPVVVTMKSAPIMAVKPTGEEVQLAEVVTAPPAEAQEATTPATQTHAAMEMTPAPAVTHAGEADRLPSTASPLPLIGLFGLLALGAAFAVRTGAKHLQ